MENEKSKMKLHKIQAIYKANVELVVGVDDGADPNKPENWDIIQEDQTDFYPYDTEGEPEEVGEEEVGDYE